MESEGERLLPILDEMECFLKGAEDSLSSWLTEAVYGDGELTLGGVIKNLTATVVSIKERSLYSSLAAWVESFQERHASMGMMVTFQELGEKAELSKVIENELCFVFQEACGNAVKHGKAGMIQILVIYQDESVKVTIADNGLGLDLEKMNQSASSGVGLGNMKKRVGRLGGKIEFLNKENDVGAVVVIDVPLNGASALEGYSVENQLGNELHDILCPEVIGVSMVLANMKHSLSEEDAKKWVVFREFQEKLSHYAGELRSLSHQLMAL